MPRSKTATKILTIAEAHIGEAYVLGARAPLSNSRWKGPWDCAEFASWCLYQSSGIIYGAEPDTDPMLADAYTGFWALLRVPQTDRTGHIAISDGKGGTIEAHSSKRGVIATTAADRRWDYGVLVPGLDYNMADSPVAYEPPIDIIRVTRVLMRGPRVKKIQKALSDLGYATGRIDGIYGPQTAHAVTLFQNDRGLVADGEVGPVTLQALGLG